MHRNPSLLLATLCVAALAGACTTDSGPSGPVGPVGDTLSRSLRGSGFTISPQGLALEHDLFQPAVADASRDVDAQACSEVQWALDSACGQLYQTGRYSWCIPQAVFFFANDIPRCAARVIIGTDENDRISETWAFDFSGEPYVGPSPSCGNGTVEPGEQCDDGNNEMWDGRDPNCQFEEFQGCEAVIEHHYRLHEIAIVDQNLWDGPRSHLMVNREVLSLRSVDQSTCNAALSTGADVCNELMFAMPFVAWCQPAVEFFTDDLGPACAVQFRVGFQATDPASGVFTTGLDGILAFTIR